MLKTHQKDLDLLWELTKPHPRGHQTCGKCSHEVPFWLAESIDSLPLRDAAVDAHDVFHIFTCEVIKVIRCHVCSQYTLWALVINEYRLLSTVEYEE